MAITRNALVELFWRIHPKLYRWTGGRIGGSIGPMPVLLLTTTGRKSGAPRTNALTYLPHGDDFVVIASVLGEPRHPAWWLNLQARPDATVDVGREQHAVRARQAEVRRVRPSGTRSWRRGPTQDYRPDGAAAPGVVSSAHALSRPTRSGAVCCDARARASIQRCTGGRMRADCGGSARGLAIILSIDPDNGGDAERRDPLETATVAGPRAARRRRARRQSAGA